MTSKAELDKGIAAIKSAYRRESNARNVLAHMLDEKERENDKLRELCADLYKQLLNAYDPKEIEEFADDLREHGVVIDR